MRVHIFFSFLLLPKFPVTLALGANVSVQLLGAVRNDARAPCVISPRVCEQQLPQPQRLSGLMLKVTRLTVVPGDSYLGHVLRTEGRERGAKKLRLPRGQWRGACGGKGSLRAHYSDTVP